jgi:lipid A 3-O-deacylase
VIHRNVWLASVLALAWTLSARPAVAQIDEVRLGAAAHNVVDEEDKEESVNVNAELVFNSPEFLEVLGGPRPFLMASINTAGETSWGGGGLYWRWEFAEGWAIEPGLGYVIHDGWVDFKFPRGDPRNDTRILFGSRDLFRETIAIERELGQRTALQVFFEHLSHGQIIGSGRNQGAETLGMRAIVRFRDQ